MMQQVYQPIETRPLERRLETRQERIFRDIVSELEQDEVWQTFESLVSVKNRYTVEHCYRVAEKMYRATVIMGLGEEDTKEYVKGALFHDRGKAIEEVREVVDYDGKLSPEQIKIVQMHAMLGAVCASFGDSDLGITVAGAHHLRYGMSRSHLTDREMYVVELNDLIDSYDAMTHRRYNSVSTSVRKSAMTPNEAVMELEGMAKKGRYSLDVFYVFRKAVEHELVNFD